MIGRTWWTSDDTRVLAAIQHNEDTYQRFTARWRRVEHAYQVRLVGSRNPFTGGIDADHVDGDTGTLPGRWRKDGRPSRNNPEGRALLTGLTWTPTPTPGLPVVTETQTLEHAYSYLTTVAAYRGRAWAAVGPCDGEPPVDRTLWTPCEEWEYVKARDDQ